MSLYSAKLKTTFILPVQSPKCSRDMIIGGRLVADWVISSYFISVIHKFKCLLSRILEIHLSFYISIYLPPYVPCFDFYMYKKQLKESIILRFCHSVECVQWTCSSFYVYQAWPYLIEHALLNSFYGVKSSNQQVLVYKPLVLIENKYIYVTNKHM